MNKNLSKIILSALLAALIYVATIIIQVPMPLTNGYVNFGDCFILVAAWILGSRWGFAAAGLGSALADALTGYMHYVPGTLIIKGLMAVVAAMIFSVFAKKGFKLKLLGYLISAVAAEIVMVLGYFAYAWLLLSKNFVAALSSIPGNIIQGLFGTICGILMIHLLEKSGLSVKLAAKFKKTV